MKSFYFLLQIFFITLISSPVLSASSVNSFIIKNSESFLGSPYLLSPLGEGKGIDADPLYRFDKFDCLTFVETVLAKSYADFATEQLKVEENISDESTTAIKALINDMNKKLYQKGYRDTVFKILMNKIRYNYKQGDISFETRNHFQNPDWINNNSEYVKNISSDIVKKLGGQEIFSEITLDRKNWFKKNYNIDIEIPKENVKLSYIPFEYFNNDFVNLIDKPYIFMTVIKDDSLMEKVGTESDVSHTGFLIKKGEKLYLRHASNIVKKVIDSEFFEYISKLQKNPKYLGFSLLEILELKSK